VTDKATPAFAMVQINIKDAAEFNERYAQHVFPILEAFGAQMIAGSPSPLVQEGPYDGNWAAVIRFPSMAVAEAWYDSPEYQPFRDMRINKLTDSGSLVFVDEFNPAAAAS
jgi:uncharacterized protein (DUF1330 family)